MSKARQVFFWLKETFVTTIKFLGAITDSSHLFPWVLIPTQGPCLDGSAASFHGRAKCPRFAAGVPHLQPATPLEPHPKS